jgi:hypothetical protein
MSIEKAKATFGFTWRYKSEYLPWRKSLKQYASKRGFTNKTNAGTSGWDEFVEEAFKHQALAPLKDLYHTRTAAGNGIKNAVNELLKDCLKKEQESIIASTRAKKVVREGDSGSEYQYEPAEKGHRPSKLHFIRPDSNFDV